jgi:hypothetical protein
MESSRINVVTIVIQERQHKIRASFNEKYIDYF